jgi:hypothetical protein
MGGLGWVALSLTALLRFHTNITDLEYQGATLENFAKEGYVYESSYTVESHAHAPARGD